VEPVATIDAAVHERVLAAHAAAGTHELAGVLGGAHTARGWHVGAFVPLPNVAADAARAFAIAPDAFLDATARLARAGTPWLGFVHGHPHSGAVPSAADRAELWRDALQLIAAGSHRRAELRAWHWRGEWREVALQVAAAMEPR
jgi:proteasome lid subunit RPN8/RPN11